MNVHLRMVGGFCLGAALVMPATCGQKQDRNEVQVMVVGTFHMANPGKDLHDAKVPDVLAPMYQVKIAEVTNALAKFKPTKVMAEWPADIVQERYPKYLLGTLPPSRNEVVQLAFRLAKTAALQQVNGIDADGDFPYAPVEAYAKDHGETPLLAEQNALLEAAVQKEDAMIASGAIAGSLRYLNDPERLRWDNSFYRATLKIGKDSQQPGADLLTAWYKRNFLICANILQNSQPGDRVVISTGLDTPSCCVSAYKKHPGSGWSSRTTGCLGSRYSSG